MPATIVEVAFHDNATDALLMRDPKGRAAVARATLHGVIKFMNAYDTNAAPPLAFLPEAPDQSPRHRRNQRPDQFGLVRAGEQRRQSEPDELHSPSLDEWASVSAIPSRSAM
jgi:hypothetical protein